MLVVVVALVASSLALGPWRAPAADAAVVADTNLFVGDGVEGRDTTTSTIIDAEVWALEEVDGVLLAGGKFLNIQDRSQAGVVPQAYLAAFDANTGEYLPWFRTQVDGPVYDIKDLGDGRVAVAGEFRSVNGLAGTGGLAIIDLATGLVDTSFSANVSGGTTPVVRSVAVVGSSVYAVGGFDTYTGADGVGHATSGAVKVSLDTGALDPAFAPTYSGGSPWGVAYNATHHRLFVVGFFEQSAGEASSGVSVLDPATGVPIAGWTPEIPDSYYTKAAALGNQIHDVETHGDRVVFTTKHHLYVVLDTLTGTQLGTGSSSGTQRVELSPDGSTAYIGCHCATIGWLRVVDLATGNHLADLTSNVTGSAGVWALAPLDNGCLWAGGALEHDSTSGLSVYNMVKLCESATPTPIPGGVTMATADTTPPTDPGMPQLTQIGATVVLDWTRATDDSGQVTYAVYRDGVEVGRSSGSTFEDRLVVRGVHQWQVRAIDLAGNLSALSSPSDPLEIGPEAEIAAGRAFQASAGAGGTTADALLDGDLTTHWLPDGEPFYFQIDLGALVAIDRVEVHESADPQAPRGLSAAAVRLSDEVLPADPSPDAVKELVFASLQVDRYYQPLVELDVAAELRTIRLDAFENFGQGITQFKVFTTPALPPPAALAPDTSRPDGPRWRRVRTISAQPVVEWGGAGDDRGVAHYEVWSGEALLGTTTLPVHPVPAGAVASAYTVVAVDAAGNRTVFDEANTAAGQPATASSVDGDQGPERAVDGNTSGVAADGSVFSSASQDQPWWEVDLGSVQSLSEVVLANRTDCCGEALAGVHVLTSSDPFPAGATLAELQADPAVTDLDLGADPLGATTTVAVAHRARYVRVMLAGTGQLHLAEVEVVTGQELGVDPPPDTTRPSVPRDLSATSVDEVAELTWSASTDDVGVVGYQVHRQDPDGTTSQIATVAGTAFTDPGVVVGESYSYHLRAYDAAGNVSWRSGSVSVTITTGVVDTQRPSVPTDLVVASVDGTASLVWSPSTDDVGVAGYQVFRNNPDGTQVHLGDTTTTAYTDATVTAGETYSYFLKAYDAAGNVSWRNGYVSVVIVPPDASSSCAFTRDGTSVTVTWEFSFVPDEVVIQRSVDASRFYWRGRVPAVDGSFVDTDLVGSTLDYRIVPKTDGVKGDPVTCT